MSRRVNPGPAGTIPQPTFPATRVSYPQSALTRHYDFLSRPWFSIEQMF